MLAPADHIDDRAVVGSGQQRYHQDRGGEIGHLVPAKERRQGQHLEQGRPQRDPHCPATAEQEHAESNLPRDEEDREREGERS